MIVCICANVNCRSIKQAIEQGANSVDSLTMKTGACSGCGQCRQACQGYIDSHNTEQTTPRKTSVVADFILGHNFQPAV